MSNQLTIKDCTRLFGVPAITLRRWIKKGKLSASLINGQYMIKQEDIGKTLSSNKEGLSIDIDQVIRERDNLINQVSNLKRENDNLINQVKELEKEIEFQKDLISRLEEDKAFLQGQIQQLATTLNLLTKPAHHKTASSS
jgi:predicted site-specific integrase-resolvase